MHREAEEPGGSRADPRDVIMAHALLVCSRMGLGDHFFDGTRFIMESAT